MTSRKAFFGTSTTRQIKIEPDLKEEEEEDPGKRQAAEFRPAVGRSVSPEILDTLKTGIKNAARLPIYLAHTHIQYMYEIVEFKGWREIVRSLADTWIENPANPQRAAAAVKRSPSHIDASNLLCGYCLFRLNERPYEAGRYWKRVREDDGLRIHNEHAETVVFIAVEDLDVHNGFFMPLRKGEDVCVDGDANVWFPATGGGGGVCLVFKI
ncbi:hypothetical protein A1O3_06109 [Capronia epimyces CBS 606.96]|uniref:Uncharacterized protein n=1 Tax=Capronia epimyces CBS 606.96 TaxID=1182542 RepID=W9XZ90_9EURO|nr:uncharacterized protein A1O3_06109 [Capronia epimyces CBS 606.96]EXJ82296.1 hypothetical protein A1O3_06109 [Capronia epimyces CBS 606.96]